MKAFATALFILGLVLEFLGFVTSNSEQLPFAMQWVSPVSFNASVAVAQLRNLERLEPEGQGFAEFETEFRHRISEINAPDLVRAISVKEIRGVLPKVTVQIPSLQVEPRISVEFALSNGQTARHRLDSYVSDFDRVRRKDLLSVASWVFGVGILLQIVGFIANSRRGSSSPSKEEPHD